jgi:hypothetical protein
MIIKMGISTSGRIAGKVICSKIKQRIREAATVPAYIAYVSKRFKWDPSIVETID